jgi:hypothetical protein
VEIRGSLNNELEIEIGGEYEGEEINELEKSSLFLLLISSSFPK